MIFLGDLRQADISFIIGTWNGIMGSSNLMYVNRHVPEQWIEELKRTGRLESRALGSRWSPHTSLQMSVDRRGFVGAHPYTHDQSSEGEEFDACEAFRVAVMVMVSESGMTYVPDSHVTILNATGVDKIAHHP
jgi:hypothetical protein